MVRGTLPALLAKAIGVSEVNKKTCAIWRCVPYATLALGLSAGVSAQTTNQQGNSTANSSNPGKLQTVTVTATAIPGATIDIDKIPGNVQIVTSDDIRRDGGASLTGALNANLSSVSINDDIDDPFQPDILYRGFEASPVLGTPEGLAVYQNGVRINEAFGDTVNWDLFPVVAIDKVELISSSPVYGRNALGGAISVTMKNGFSYQGGDRMRDIYIALSMHTDALTIDLSYTRSDNVMEGQGPAPIQELALNRSLVFTGPQNNTNDLNFFTLNSSYKVTDTWSVQSVFYYRQYYQSVSNGNTTDYIACTNTPGILCQSDGLTPLTNAAGQTLPDISDNGAYLLGENDYEYINAWSRGTSLQVNNNDSIFGHDNEFTIGAALDYASNTYYTGAQIGLLNAQLIVLPSDLIVDTPENSAAASAFGDPVPVSVDSINKSLGTYFTDTFNVTQALAVTASGRYNISNIDLFDQLGTNLNGYNRYTHFNPAIGATYKVLPSMTLYGGIANNTRTPTASEIECSSPTALCLLPTNLAGDPPTLKQVVSHTSEVGLRGTLPDVLDGQITWNLSAFRTLLENDIFGVATSVSAGYFQNIGDTRRQGFEAGIGYHADKWSAYANYSYVQATFESPLLLPSPSNPYQDANGNIQVLPGDRMPGIPESRLKIGVDYKVIPQWTVGTSVIVVGDFYYVGDASNQLAPIGGYTTVDLHTSYKPFEHFEFFATVNNLLNRKYATWGILSDPSGQNAPGVPANGPYDPRFPSPAAPLEVFAGVRISL